MVVSSVICGILSIEVRDIDTKLLSCLESNNTLARCWFRRNVLVTTLGSWHDKSLTLVQVASSGWPLVLAVPGLITHFVASLTLDILSISLVGFLPSILLLVVAVVVVTVILVVVVGGVPSIIKLSFVNIGSLHRTML
ncbi:hypothetical protein Tco_1324181 [Tanacetum coccineum]